MSESDHNQTRQSSRHGSVAMITSGTETLLYDVSNSSAWIKTDAAIRLPCEH